MANGFLVIGRNVRIPLRAARLHKLTRLPDEKKADSKDDEKIVGSWPF